MPRDIVGVATSAILPLPLFQLTQGIPAMRGGIELLNIL